MMHEEIDELPLPQEHLDQMQNTRQNPRYHAEGDVLAHTKMVVRKFFELKSRFRLSQEDEKVLYWASVLHDIGKPVVTRLENDRWVASGHEQAGVPIARKILLERTDLNYRERQKVLDLVRWHGLPLYYALHEIPEDKLKLLGTRIDLRLLSVFGIIDLQGRICENQDQLLERADHFHAVEVPGIEYRFGQFDQLLTTFREMGQKYQNATWKALEMKKLPLIEKIMANGETQPSANGFSPAEIVMTIGPALSGKTETLKTHFPDGLHLQLKDFRLTEQDELTKHYLSHRMVELKYLLRIYLRRNKQILLDGRNIHPELRIHLNRTLRDLNVKIHYLIVESPLEELLQRNQQTEAPMEEASIIKQFHEFPDIHPWEAHQVTWVTT